MTFLQRALPVVLLGAAALGLLAGCGGDLTLPNEGEPAHLLVQRGDGQHGTAGAALPDSIVVRVTDSRDRPVSGVAVAFVLQGKAGGSLRPQDTVQTDAAGRAAVLWVLGDAAGAQQLQVRVTGATATLTADLTATAGAGTAATLAAVSGDAQTATAGTPLPDSLVVHVSDADGNPVAGVEVSWTLTGGGAVSAAQTTSGADGRTGVVRTLGPAVGTQTTVATAVGLAGSPVTFTATARAGAAGALSITTQPSATAQSGVAFATAPVVRLLDANGNPVTTSGVAVTATIATGEPGAQLIGQSTRGTTNGVATFSGLGIQGPAGSYTLTFGGADLVGVTSQPITIAGGAAAKLAVVTQPGPSGGVASGVVFPQQPQVRLVDASGNAVSQAGITVTATLTGPNAASGALNGDRTQSTNASGVATFTDLSITGPPANYTILFAATNLVSATSQAVGVGLGSSTTQIGASKSATVVGEPYTVSVAVSGSGSTPTGTVAVSDQKGATCNAALSGGSGSCTLRSTSAGNHELLASYGGDGEHGGSSATLAHTV
ncbi:MAG TPA: Ig-like domain repeat protein, partial [Gemmatimonadales bacterium]|nr:Ig-like domain repeat protein [Gemmatimonadales bacterium]